MNRGLISIVMSARNAAQYLKECIDSIIIQDETNWELIVINNKSSDNTRLIVEEYSRLDGRISIYNILGKGLIESLSTGYQYAKGEYVTRMDADDIMPPNKLGELKKMLIGAGHGSLATGHVRYFPKEIIGDGYKKYELWLNNLCDTKSHFQEIYKECVIPSPCWMVYKVDFDKLGAFKSCMYPEDYELAFRFYKAKLKIHASDKILHLWRDYPQRASRNQDKYSEPHFFELKLKYFFELEYDSSKDLILWGTGAKGKFLADNLQSKQIEFSWMCDNERKHGVDIRGVIIEDFKGIKNRSNFQLIIAVAQRGSQDKIRVFLDNCGLLQNKDYFFFC